jgi:hypothetical protein
MIVHLWHFTRRAEDARQIQAEGFRDYSSYEFGLRWPCFSLAGERRWEIERGPALVEVWLEIDEQELDGYEPGRGDDEDRTIFYQIPPAAINAYTVKRLAHDNADHIPRIPISSVG